MSTTRIGFTSWLGELPEPIELIKDLQERFEKIKSVLIKQPEISRAYILKVLDLPADCPELSNGEFSITADNISFFFNRCNYDDTEHESGFRDFDFEKLAMYLTIKTNCLAE